MVAAAIVAFAVLFAGLTLPNTDGYIARYNVDRYLAGTLETVDVDAMEDLGLAAVPQMVRLMDVLEDQEDKGTLYLDTTQCLHRIHRAYLREDASLFSWSIPYQQAKNAIEGLDMEAWVKVYCGY